MRRCLDCGFCGFYVDFGGGLQWYEMDNERRRAFETGQDSNPPGVGPGTGHWNKVKCLKDLNELSQLVHSNSSRDQIKNTLSKKRKCREFYRYRSGFSPPLHENLKQENTKLHLNRLDTLIAVVALIISIVSILISLFKK